MASRIIETIRVRPSGAFASWRWGYVLVDENGNVSFENVPGELIINQNCITDYSRNDRRYVASIPATPADQKANSLMTEFCDLVTHTNYRIYAQNCKPFAYAETDLNAAKCGYQEPLPTPADPPNPYGTLKYQNYKYTEFCDSEGETIRVDIMKKYNFIKPQTLVQVDQFRKTGLFGFLTTTTVVVDRIKHTVIAVGPLTNDQGTNRSYEQDELITEFCDYEIGSNLKIYTQTTYPFAYIIEETNALQCSIPVIEPEYIENWGEDPVILSYKGDDNKLATFAPCECILNLLCEDNFSLSEFYTADEREFKVIVTKGGRLQFAGFIIPDSCQEPFAPTPYEVQIRATDGLGALKNITYTLPAGSKVSVRQTFLEIIAYCLAPTNLNLNIRTICNIYETVMKNGLDDDSLAQAKVSPLRFTGENGNLFDCYQVLEEVLKLFKAVIFQANGEWIVARRDELANDTARSRLYNQKAFFLNSERINPIKEITNMDTPENVPINMDQNILIGNPYKRASVLTKFGKTPSIIFNGDFEQWDGTNFLFWTKYGGILVSRVQDTIPGNGFSRIPINSYVCRFDERAQANKYIQSNEISVIQGDTLELNFSTSPFVGLGSLKFRIKLGKYYLTNAVNGTDFQWVTALSTVTVRLGLNNNGNLFQFIRSNISLTMPDAPETAIMVIQFYGPQMYDYNASNGTYVENTNYNPVDIDGVSISKKSKIDDRLQDGMINISEQELFYTQKPLRQEVLFGDFQPIFNLILDLNLQLNVGNYNFINPALVVPNNSQTPDTSIVLDNLYAIYTSDGSYSTLWYEYGTTSGRIPIGLLLAKGILRSYQKPFNYINGSYLSINATFLNTYRFNLDCIPEFSQKIFSLLSCDIGLKSNTIKNVNMVEIFDKYIKTIDTSQPHHPNDVEPPISSNPNTPPINPTERIFTEEFTPEFK